MRARAGRLGEIAVEPTFGAIVAADLRTAAEHIAWQEGKLLGPADTASIAPLHGVEVHLVELDPGEVGPDEVAHRLARAIGGSATTADAPQQGQARLRAASRGLLAVDGDAVRALNRLGPVLCFTSATVRSCWPATRSPG